MAAVQKTSHPIMNLASLRVTFNDAVDVFEIQKLQMSSP